MNDTQETPAIFQAVRREGTLTSRLVQQLEALMEEQKLMPGDRLPAEREMTQQFGVSRTVIREAVSALVAKGLLEPLLGGGVVVRTPNAESVSRSLYMLMRTGKEIFSYGKVNEVRHLLEVEIAGLAAERHDRDDLVAIEAALAESAIARQDRTSWAQNDVSFHAAIARATHNELFPLLLESIADVLFQVRERGFDVDGSIDQAIIHHTAILDAIRQRDAAGARLAMQIHLADAEEVQRRADLQGKEAS